MMPFWYLAADSLCNKYITYQIKYCTKISALFQTTNSSHTIQMSGGLAVQTVSPWRDHVARLHHTRQRFLPHSTRGAASELLCSGSFSTLSIRCASPSAYPHWCVAPASSGITVSAGKKKKKGLSVERHFALHPSFSCNVKLERQGHVLAWRQALLFSACLGLEQWCKTSAVKTLAVTLVFLSRTLVAVSWIRLRSIFFVFYQIKKPPQQHLFAVSSDAVEKQDWYHHSTGLLYRPVLYSTLKRGM